MPKHIQRHKCGEVVAEDCEYTDEAVKAETLFNRINNTRTERDNCIQNAEAARESARKYQELAERRAEQVNAMLRIAQERGLIQ